MDREKQDDHHVTMSAILISGLIAGLAESM
jgi:hypothetical protein